MQVERIRTAQYTKQVNVWVTEEMKLELDKIKARGINVNAEVRKFLQKFIYKLAEFK